MLTYTFLTFERVSCSVCLREMSVMSWAIFCSMVPTICAPVKAIEAVMLKVPLGFMAMPPLSLDSFEAGKLNVSGKVPRVPRVTDSGIIDAIDIELRPPRFIV